MISPSAIEAFLARSSGHTFTVRARDPDELRQLILDRTGIPFEPKMVWQGNDRDIRQLEAIALAVLKERLLLYYSMRVGKTKIGLDWLEHLHKARLLKKALIVPHAPVGVDEWERQAPIHSNLDLSFVRSGPASMDDFSDAIASDSAGIVMTWSTLQQLFTEKRTSRKGKPKLYANNDLLEIAAGAFQGAIIDEIHRVNDPLSLRFDIISGLLPESIETNRWRMGMTGTPFGRDPYGVWSQARLIDGGEALSRSFFFFREAFGKTQYQHFAKNKKEIIFDPNKMPVLRQKLGPRMLTCKLTDIQDVNVIASRVDLRLTSEQRAAYKDVIDGVIEGRQFGLEEAQNSFIRLRQVSSGLQIFTDDEGNRRELELPSCKHDWLEDFLSDLDPALKVVIFHEFIATGKRISRTLDKLKIKHHWLWGGAKDRKQMMADFQEGDTPVFVANHAAGGTGIDLSAAHYICFFESPVSGIGRQQSEARPLARGAAPLVMDDLVCSPVERRILDFHKEGKELSELFQSPANFRKGLRLT